MPIVNYLEKYMTTLIIAVILVILISAICSSTEAALFSVPIIKVRKMAEDEMQSKTTKLRIAALISIREKMNRPISMLVILNNITNMGGTTLVTLLAIKLFESFWVGILSGILTLAVIAFAEIIPMTIGDKHSLKISLIAARPVLFLTRLTTPLIWIIEGLASPFHEKDGQTLPTDEQEIHYMTHIGDEENVIEADELEMINGVFQLNDVTARQLMTPRISLTCIEGDASIQTVIDEVIESQHSRIVVIGESRDEILGVVLKTRLLTAMIKGKGDEKIRDHGYLPVEVHHNNTADDILPIFQKSHQHLAIVRDEFGGVDGVITLEDIIEELTGEIIDETDTDEDMRLAPAS